MGSNPIPSMLFMDLDQSFISKIILSSGSVRTCVETARSADGMRIGLDSMQLPMQMLE
jgi:hypothetical protein